MKKNSLVLILLFCSSSVFASELKDQFSLDIGSDSNGTRSTNLGYQHQTDGRYEILVGVGASRYEPLTDEIRSRSFRFGVNSDPEPNFSVGGHVDVWGLNDEFQSSSLSVPMYFRNNDWLFGVMPNFGRLKFQNIGVGQETRTTSSNGLGASAFYDLEGPWRFGISVAAYSYGEDLTAFSNDIVAQYFSQTTLAFVGGLLKRRSFLEADYDFETWNLALRLGRSVSAIDESVSGFIETAAKIKLNEQWDLNLMIAAAKTNDYGLVPSANQTDERVRYGSLGAVYRY